LPRNPGLFCATQAAPRGAKRLGTEGEEVFQGMTSDRLRKRTVDDPESTTLDYVIRCIYRKLHVNCVAAAVSVAIRGGIVTRR
jgi:hypothetical protein